MQLSPRELAPAYPVRSSSLSRSRALPRAFGLGAISL